MNTAFDADALFAKSKVFLERGLVARDTGDLGLFHMWAALALELLGKSALASVHPVLVADPTKFSSLLSACGRLDTDAVRSITAKTVYERLGALSNQYDRRSEDFCMLMANRRNEELHSGSSPVGDLKSEAWVSEFWRVSRLILAMRSKLLTDWVGDAEAASASRLIEDSSRALEEAVAARIRRRAAEFERQYPPDSPERKYAADRANSLYWPIAMRAEVMENDAHEKQDCPACHCSGWIFGVEIGEHRAEPEFDPEGGWLQTVETDYNTEVFACPTCDLRLVGREELDFAKLPEVFTKAEAEEPDYGPEYGND